MCDHSGTHSGASRYVREEGELRLVLLCDQCGAERQELGRIEYRPEVVLPGPQSAALAADAPALAEPKAA
ncbi:MAG TPA: hypothetical protein VJU80_03090 [Solirubrobacteraceae bacterium]|nr:hypothetical protein [Solirubrobacteraceae bacterium]